MVSTRGTDATGREASRVGCYWLGRGHLPGSLFDERREITRDVNKRDDTDALCFCL
jgi:hypothetical protein